MRSPVEEVIFLVWLFCRHPVVKDEGRFFQRVLPEQEPHLGSRHIRSHGQGVRVQRMNGDQVLVPPVAGGRKAAAVARESGVIANLDCLFRHQVGGRVSGVRVQFPDGGGNVDGEPVPETASGGRVRVMDGNGKAPCPFRRIGPEDFGGLVAAADAGVTVDRRGDAAQVFAVECE